MWRDAASAIFILPFLCFSFFVGRSFVFISLFSLSCFRFFFRLFGVGGLGVLSVLLFVFFVRVFVSLCDLLR